MHDRTLPDGLAEAVDEALVRLETRTGRRLGDPADPLLVSVRSGARDSMPGMMDSVLNLGLNDESVRGLAARTGDERFAWDSYRRLVQMFGNVVCGVPGERFEVAIAEAKRERGVTLDTELDVAALRELTGRFQALYDFPTDPARAARARDPRGVRLLERRARRRLSPDQRHPRRLGHRGQRAADGLRQPRRALMLRRGVLPRRDHRRARAERRLPAQRAGRGRRLRRAHPARPRRAARLDARGPRAAHGHPADAGAPLPATCRTRSSPWRRGACTCCRRATPSAPPRPPCASPSMPSRRACSRAPRRSRRSTPAGSTRCCTRRSTPTPATRCSRAASRPRRAPPRARSCSPPRTPWRPPPTAGGHPRAPVHGGRGRRRLPRRAQGILTSEGGKASHAALVARGMGRPAVTGAAALDVDLHAREVRIGDRVLHEGELIVIDGTTGAVTTDDVPLVAPPVDAHFETVLAWCDEPAHARRARQRRHARRRAPRAVVRRGGDRAVPDGAHVHGRRPPAQDAGGDHGRGRRRPARGARRAAAAPAGRLRGPLRGDGRPAGDDPPARPAAARVPARSLRAGRAADRGPAAGDGRCRGARAPARADARARGGQPDAGDPRRPARPHASRPLRDAGEGDLPRGVRGARAHRQGAGRRGDDPARRLRSRARAGARAGRARRGRRGMGRRPQGRHDDRAAAGLPRRGRDRAARRLLLLRHQRPHPDRARLLARRHRRRGSSRSTPTSASSSARRSGRSTPTASAS